MLLGRAMIGPLFSQSAWNNVTFTGGEVRDPGRNLPRALVLGCGTVVILYLLANIAYILTLSLDQIQHAPQDRVGTAVMEAVFGRAGTVAMALAILVSTFGCVNEPHPGRARVYYAMARDGLFFDRVGTTNRQHVPAVALVAQGVWACLLALPVTVTLDASTQQPTYGNLYSQLLEYIIPVDVAFYMLMVGAVILLRRKSPEAERPYRTLGFPPDPLDLPGGGGPRGARLHRDDSRNFGNRCPDRTGGNSRSIFSGRGWGGLRDKDSCGASRRRPQ